MKIGILEAGAPPAPLQERFGSYASMVAQLLGPQYEFKTFDARTGELPARAEACHAYVITGSAAGVYDGLPWIEALKSFTQQASGTVPFIGLCFGHQLMAEAFGGRVTKSPKGWGIGLHTYALNEHAPWMDREARSISIPVSHQDQVVELPADARVLGGSEFTPFGLLEYPRRKAISLQSHPEFSPEYTQALIELRRNGAYSAELADRAIATLRAPNDRERVAAWLRRFLESTA